MRIRLDSGNTPVLENGTHEVHKKDASKHIGKSTASIIDDYDGDKTTITPFEEMLNESVEKIMQGSESDKITQASELSSKELAKLYVKLGIKSAAGDKVESYNENDTESAGTAGTSAANSIGNTVVTDYSSNSTDRSYTVPKSMQPIFKSAAEKYGVAYELLTAVACAESDFNPNCTSRSGAMGVMQLMPGTAKYLGVKNAYDPEQNIMGGSRYLAEKLKEHGSVKLALAAYNAGSNAVEKYNGVPPYTETQNYIKRILGYLGTDGSESGFTNIYKSNTDSTQNFNYVAAPDDVPADTLIQIGDNKSMSYSSYLKYVELIS